MVTRDKMQKLSDRIDTIEERYRPATDMQIVRVIMVPSPSGPVETGTRIERGFASA